MVWQTIINNLDPFDNMNTKVISKTFRVRIFPKTIMMKMMMKMMMKAMIKTQVKTQMKTKLKTKFKIIHKSKSNFSQRRDKFNRLWRWKNKMKMKKRKINLGEIKSKIIQEKKEKKKKCFFSSMAALKTLKSNRIHSDSNICLMNC